MKFLVNKAFWGGLALGLNLFLFVGACTPQPTAAPQEPRPVATASLTPTNFPIPVTPSPTLGTVLLPTRTPVPALQIQTGERAAADVLPTATPFIHTIAEGDTLLGVAFLYGLTLEDVLAANPAVDPNFLSVGTNIVIPLTPNESGGFDLLPAPLVLLEDQSACFSRREGGWTCFLLVRNENEAALENLSAQITLFDPEGESAASEIAVPDLNVLPPGAEIPLVAHFAGEIGEVRTAGAVVLSAVRIPAGDTRYWEAEANLEPVEFGQLGVSADVTGQVFISDRGDDSAPGLLWVVLVAYDAGDRVVGTRKLIVAEAESPRVGMLIPFSESVFSLGPVIQRVAVLLEVR